MNDNTVYDNKSNTGSGTLPKGTVLHGTYRIEGLLGSGGFGNTYVATNLKTFYPVAVKEFFLKGVSVRGNDQTTVSISSPDNKATFAAQMEKFQKEALRIQGLDNSHIVRVHELFPENSTYYYVMDYISGESLSARLKRTGRPVSETETRNILLQLLDALQTVHTATPPILHLDIKPGNIMVDSHGNVKLIDFGASKQLKDEGGATATSAISYTNGYAPFEQMEQDPSKFGPWTDFYAVGATLYNLLTNSKPPMPSTILGDTKKDKSRTLTFPSNVSKQMRRLVVWLMEPNRAKRPQSVKEIYDYLGMGNNNTADDPTRLDKPPVPPTPTLPPAKKKKNSVGGCLKKTLIIIVICIAGLIAYAVIANSLANKRLAARSTEYQAEQDSIKEARKKQAKIDSLKDWIVDLPDLSDGNGSRYDWSGSYGVGTNRYGDEKEGFYNISFTLKPTYTEDDKYVGKLDIGGDDFSIVMSDTAYAHGNVIEVYSGVPLYPDAVGADSISSNAKIVTLRYKSDKTLSVEWHQAIKRYINSNSTSLRKTE